MLFRSGSADDVTGLAVAGWALVHGFATLLLTNNLDEQVALGEHNVAQTVIHGVATLGRLANRQLKRDARHP